MIVVDDENEDFEGTLIMAASHATPEMMAFMVKHGSGIVSVGMKEEDLERLKLPLMSPESEDKDSSAPTFTITVVCIMYGFSVLAYLKLAAIVYFKLCASLGCKNRYINWSFGIG